MKMEIQQGLVFGLNIGELLGIYDHDSQSWKMSECLFTGDYAKFSEALPKSGMMRNGRIYEQATWVRRTGGKESGLLPTPVGYDATPGGPGNHYRGLGHMAKFPTPQVFDATCGDLKGKEYNGETRHAMKLIQAVKRFPTPHSNCHTGPGKRGDGGENLQTAVMWPTPTASDAMTHPKDCQRFQSLDVAIRQHKTSEMAGGQLNPTWVDWLMGYPIGWTDLGDSETRLSLK